METLSSTRSLKLKATSDITLTGPDPERNKNPEILSTLPKCDTNTGEKIKNQVSSFSRQSPFLFSQSESGLNKMKLYGNYLISLMDVYGQTRIIMARKSNLGPQLPRLTVYIDQINWIMAKNALYIVLCIYSLRSTSLCFGD